VNAKTKIKVNRERLIQAITDRRDAEQIDYENAVEEYEQALTDWPNALATALSDLATRVHSGAIAPGDLYDRYGDWKHSLPTRPAKPSRPKNRQLAISQLTLSDDETILISGEDFAAYIQ